MNKEELAKLRHSTSHVLASAVKRLWPEAKLGIGPAIENGFYYDFDKKDPFKPEDLPKIEEEMQKIIGQNLPFVKKEISKKEALGLFGKIGEDYKIKLLEEIEEDNVSIYTTGDFVDLCRGPHVKSTKEIKAFKLLSIAGAYWKGSENNPMMQRIYGTAFESGQDLEKHIKLLEEAKKRDHRELGKQLELFSFNESVGAGLVLYHPKGAILRYIIEDYIRKEHLKRGYQLVVGPNIMKSDIWVTSGHYGYYKENMYIFEIEGQEYAVKPMNCPGHIIVYRSRVRSYRELPIRFFELGNVYRHEKTGVLHGLLRVRGFTQDDAHIFCLKSQVKEEIIKVIDFVIETLNVFGFMEFSVEISTRPEKFIGEVSDWELATKSLKEALDAKKLEYRINEGEGAFYGPKIDIKLKDALGREWQCATIQCDFALPERFDLTYTDIDGSLKRPVMLHRVILGSIERFTGALIEHYGGLFPLWLAPVQVSVIPISERHSVYAEKVMEFFAGAGLRVKMDNRDEKMQKRIREAELERIPYMIVLGDKESENNTVSVRSKNKKPQTTMSAEEFVEKCKKEIESKKSF